MPGRKNIARGKFGAHVEWETMAHRKNAPVRGGTYAGKVSQGYAEHVCDGALCESP